MSADILHEIDRCIRRDPAQRGLIGTEPRFGALCPGHLAASALDLASTGSCVAIVTGFYIPGGDPPAAETDGPPGALLLARTLLNLGIESHVVTDGYCFHAVAVAAQKTDFPFERLVRYPHPDDGSNPAASGLPGGFSGATSRWRNDYFQSGPGRSLSHLIAIERVGPSHTAESLARQLRNGPAPVDRFNTKVPPADRDHCHNMRGENLDRFAGDVHLLFEEASEHRPDAKTIGIGDGANEIGMGVVAWEELERRLTGESSGRVPCRVGCDWNIIAGTSNWGAYALAAAVALIRDRVRAIEPFDCRQQREVLEYTVDHGPAVDGVTRRREPTVDGLAFSAYIEPWRTIRARLGLRG